MRPVLALGVVCGLLAMGGCQKGAGDSSSDSSSNSVSDSITNSDSNPAGAPDGSNSKEKRRPLVFIDPGHGGGDEGAVGPSGVVEKDLVLSVAEHLRRQLTETGLVDAVIAREADQDLDLVRRPRMANAAEADVFVSLHMNWAEDARATGIETYYLDTATDEAAERLAVRENLNAEDLPTDLENILSDLRLTGNVAASRALAERVHRELVGGLEEFYGDGEVRDRGLRTALFAVLVRAEMPAVLVELCFLSNPEEERRARTRAYQEEAAQAIAGGVIGFLRDQGQLPPPDPLAGDGEGSAAGGRR